MHPLEQQGVEALGRGWSVIATGPQKTPLGKWKEWQTKFPSVIDVRRWLNDTSKKPSCLAVVTGELSGLVVLDFDGEPGDQLLKELNLKPHVRTGSGGHHVYFKHPGVKVATINSKAAKESLGKAFPGLDIRADGGYAIFAGQSEKGSYEVLRDLNDLESLDALPIPVQQAIGLLPEDPQPVQTAPVPVQTSPAPAPAVASDLPQRKLAQAIAKAEAGEGRNIAGFWLAQQLRDNQLTFAEAQAVMYDYQQAVTGLLDNQGQPDPYPWDEALTTLRGCYNSPAREPETQKAPTLPSLRSRSVFDSMFSLGQLLDQPDKGWYLKNFLGPQELVMIAGQPGAGKTFLVLDLCMALALGRDWARTFPFEAEEPLRVAYFAGEGVGRLGKRVRALLDGYQVSLEDVGDRFQVFGGVPNLANLTDPNSVLGIVEEYKSRDLPFPQVIVIDTLARSIPGSDENSSRDAGQIINGLDYLKQELGCAVIVVHHTGKNGETERGSSAFKGAMDGLFKVQKTDTGGSLVADKLKDAEEFEDVEFSLMPTAESCVVGWGVGQIKVSPVLTFLRTRPGERLDLTDVHTGLGSTKSDQTTRKELEKLVRDGKVKSEKEGKKMVWWVNAPKPGTITVDFSETTYKAAEKPTAKAKASSGSKLEPGTMLINGRRVT